MKLLFTRGPKHGLRLFLLILLSIGLMVLDHHEYLSPLRKGLNMVTTPIQYAVDFPANLFVTLKTNLASRRVLLAENASLQAQQLLLQGKLQKLLALENENKELQALLKTAGKRSNDEKIDTARLLAVSMSPFVSEIILNKGIRNGVYEGQPVIDAYGIMGQVIQAGQWTSRVLLLTDLRSAIPVQDMRNGMRGIVVGRGNLVKLALTNIPETVDIQAGDILVSSGLGGNFPPGYPVGKVSSIQHNSGEQFTKIDVIPIAQLDRSRNVLLIWVPHAPAIDLPKMPIKSLIKNHKTAASTKGKTK